MRLILITYFLLLPAIGASAQTAKPSPSAEETTKLEKFQGRTGAVIIKGFTRMGSMTGTGGSVEVSSMDFTDAQTGRKEQGVLIEVTESGRLSRSGRSYIDYDEIDSLLKGIDYIAKIQPSVTKQSNFEAIYRTRGDFSVTTFNENKGDISVAISSGRIGKVDMYLPLADLPSFRDLIVQAKTKLDAPQ